MFWSGLLCCVAFSTNALSSPWKPSLRSQTTPFATSSTSESSPKSSKYKETRSKLTSAGEAGALTYGFTSVLWYSIGVPIVLVGLPDPVYLSKHLVGDAVRRCVTAWGLCFAASQATTVFRITAAIALSPFTSRVLKRLRKEGSPLAKPKWLAPVFLAVSASSVFAATLVSLVLNEYYALTLLKASRAA